MFWKIDFSELPSKGYTYKNGTIRIRPMNVGDMKFLATINPNNCTRIINELLYNCIELTNINFDDILLCDRMYFCFWLRANSLVTHNGYTFNLTCSHCSKQFEKEITLNDFDTRYITSLPETVELDDVNAHIKLKLPTIKDLDFKFYMNDDLEKIGRCIDNIPDERTKRVFLQQLSAMDYAILMGRVKNLDTAFEEDFSFDCPHCNHSNDFKIKITDDGLFNGIDLYAILQRIVHITKYTSMQINDDMPWMEIELYADIVNKMIEEENEQNQKQQAQMNGKLSSIKSSSSIKKPNIQKPNIHR